MSVIKINGQFKNDEERQGFLAGFPQSVPQLQTLVDAQNSRYAYVDAMRELACEADVSALGYFFQSNQRSKDLLNGAVALASNGLPLPEVWRSTNNVNVSINSIADLLAIAGAMAVAVQAAYLHSWVLKAQIEAALDIDSVNSIVW